MASKYKRVEKKKEDIANNEIRCRKDDRYGGKLRRAHTLLSSGEADHIVIKGMQNAIDVALRLAELIKHRIAGLH